MDMETTKKGKAAVKLCGKMVDKNISPIVFIRAGGKKGSNKVIMSWMRDWTTLDNDGEMKAFTQLI